MNAAETSFERSKATRINLFSLKTPQMRAFHLTWLAFFLAFFGWFGIAPLMALVREDLLLTKTQIGNTIIASVAITIMARLAIGWLCDRIGPRLAYRRAADSRLYSGDVHRPRTKLRDVPALSAGDRRHRRIIRHHSVPHFRYVLVERDRHGECDDGRLGKHGRWCHADCDATGAGGRADVRCGRNAWLAAGNGGARRGTVPRRHRVLLPHAGRPPRQLQGPARERA